MKINTNGTPSLPANKNTAENIVALADVVTGTPPASSFSALVSDMLSKHDGAVRIVVDTKNRKVYCASSEAKKVMLDELHVFNDGQTTTLTPDAGQSGSALTYTKTGGTGSTDLLKSAIAGAVDAAKPRRSITSLVQSILGAEHQDNPPLILIDQDAGTVKVVDGNNIAADDFVGNLGNAGAADGLKVVELSNPASGNGSVSAVKLVFEGGAV